MAVIIGEIYRGSETASQGRGPFAWLTQRFGAMLTHRNPSSFPDRVWQRHSALLDAAKQRRVRHAVDEGEAGL